MATFKRRLKSAIARAEGRVAALSDGSKYGSALSGEGYDAGYRDCLYDVAALLAHGYPSDQRDVWKERRP